jgi:DNA-binding transcriptional LysR family regulator
VKLIDYIFGIRLVNLSSFDLNLLRMMDSLLRERSTVKAAERVGLSQPAVSSALGRLRHSLGDTLFLRRGQGLEPTDYATSIAIPLRVILDDLESLLGGPSKFDPASSNASFKLSGSDFFAEMLMPKLAEQVSKLAPGMHVQLVDLVPDNFTGTLERYEVDLALIPATQFPDWVDHRPMFWSSFSVIARRDHPRLKRAGVVAGSVIPIDLFCDLGHVLFSPEGKLRPWATLLWPLSAASGAWS